MSKHYFFSTFIGAAKQHHLIKIISLLAVILSIQTVAVQLQIIQDAHAISQQQAATAPIPDPNLRTAIAEALGKSPNAPITTEEMERLERIEPRNRGIRDLSGLQFATNLKQLILVGNQISDLSPIAGLINLQDLRLNSNPISDLSPLRGLTNINHLVFRDSQVSDLSPIAGLTKLRYLMFTGTNVTNLSPIAGLINLEQLGFSNRDLSDLSPLAGLINLERVFSWENSISDLSPIARLTKLEIIDFCGGNISNLTPLAGLTGLTELYLVSQNISDISPLARLTGLTRVALRVNNISNLSPLRGLAQLKWLQLEGNNISDVSPLAGLVNLTWLDLSNNEIVNFSPLDRIRENIKLFWYGNPAFPEGGPKIEGPWLWVVLLDTELSSSMDLLSEASGGTVTEMQIAIHGATEGKPVGDDMWTAHNLPPTGRANIEDMLQRTIHDGVLYGSISLYSPRQQETTMYVGGEDGAKVWLNGAVVYEDFRRREADDYEAFFPVTLKQGRNMLLVAVHTLGTGFFGFEPGTEYTAVNPGVSYTFSKTPIHTGDTFTLDIGAKDVFDMAGWQFDIDFDPVILEAINVNEGNFLKADGSSTFFQTGTTNNATGKITEVTAARTSAGGASGTDTLLQVTFRAKARGATALTLQNVEFGDPTGTLISAGPHEIRITVGGQLATGDVNRDGAVTILDLILIARQLGQRVPPNSQVDLNGDGAVSILDLILAARSLGSTTTPAAPPVGVESIDAATVAAWIAEARLKDDGSLAFKQGIAILEKLLTSLIPQETALLRNYPNPFNPETWIPYQLAQGTDVTLTIYDTRGVLVRQLDLGYQQPGYYADRTRAAYWDGRNNLGEAVGSGVYFYHLRAGDYSTTRKMLILK